VLANGKRCPNEALPGSRYCGIPAHQELALRDTEDTEIVETEDEPALEIRSDLVEPDAESLGPESFEPARAEEELESEAPADAAATHGPDATAVAAAEDEVDLDTVHPRVADAEPVPAGIPVEPASDRAEEPATPVDLDVEGRTTETPSEGSAPGAPVAQPVPTDEGTPTA
jgi:N utilization substance protein A